MLLNGCTGFSSYLPEDSCSDPRQNAARLLEGKCEGITSKTNFNLFINCLCEISEAENANCISE